MAARVPEAVVKRSALPKRRKPLRRSRLRQGKGRKAEREQPARDEFAEVLETRARGRCETLAFLDSDERLAACGTTSAHEGCDPHHIWPEDRDAGVHDPERGLWLCRRAHRYVHDHPAWAKPRGLLRPEPS